MRTDAGLRTLQDVVQGLSTGQNLLENKGGVFVDEETLDLVAKVEMALEAYSGPDKFMVFTGHMLTVTKNAQEEGDNVLQAIEDWLDATIAENKRNQN